MRTALTAFLLLATPAFAAERTVTVDVWADNWFAMYVNGSKVLEDSVPITTERSFNAETAQFSVALPAQIAFIAKDFKENDTGLEYIGSRRQQMGDGGFIAQFKDAASGETLAVTDQNTRCMVIHHGPVDTSCAKESNPVAGQGACAFEAKEEPSGWADTGFDDSDWPQATEHSERAVRPKDGYDRIRWDNSAELIWSDDLERDNTLLCRLTISE